jgi:hypothetical protein
MSLLLEVARAGKGSMSEALKTRHLPMRFLQSSAIGDTVSRKPLKSNFIESEIKG